MRSCVQGVFKKPLVYLILALLIGLMQPSAGPVGARSVTVGVIPPEAWAHGMNSPNFRYANVNEIPQADDFSTWRAEYFNNLTLSGTPALIRDEPTIDYTWESDSPKPGIINQRRDHNLPLPRQSAQLVG